MIRSSRRITIGHTETGGAQFAETANFGGLSGMGSGMGVPAGTGTTSLASPAIDLPLLDGFMPQDKISINRMYREMYNSDPVASSAVQMLSTLPFSDFSLTGMNDERRLSKYVQSVERMRVRQLLPVISTDYLVFGSHISVMNWNEQERIYDALLPQNVDFCELTPVPIAGADPLVKLTFPPEILQAFQSKDKRMQDALERIPEEIRKTIGKAGYDLKPEDLLFIGRYGTSGDFQGTSAFTAMLPIWLIEKALYRGTLDQSWKRQRGILHVTMGDPEWTPTEADYTQVGQWFGNADMDPTGAIVVTRDGVNVNEIRRGDDFWKVNDVSDWATKMKLMSLGISENFISGDGNVTSMENSLSVILQHFSHYREEITRELFYDKNFPTIARENGYFRRQNIAISSQERYEDGFTGLGYPGMNDRIETASGFMREMDGTFTAEFGAKSSTEGSYYDKTKYEMPKVHWHNSLKADSSRDYMDMLSTMEEKGVPIPLRAWAAAGGFTVRELVESRISDGKIREYFKPWVKEIQKYKASVDPALQAGDGGNPDDAFEGASAIPTSPSLGGPLNMTPWYNKDYGEALGPRVRNYRDQPVAVSQRRAKEINEKANKETAEAAALVHAKANHIERGKQTALRGKSYHYSMLDPKKEPTP